MSELFDRQFCAHVGYTVAAFAFGFLVRNFYTPASAELPKDQFHNDKLSLRAGATALLLPILRAAQPPIHRSNVQGWVSSNLQRLEESGEWSWLPPSRKLTASLKNEVLRTIVTTITSKHAHLLAFTSTEAGQSVKREKSALPSRRRPLTGHGTATDAAARRHPSPWQGAATDAAAPGLTRSGQPSRSDTVLPSSLSRKRTHVDDGPARPSKKLKRQPSPALVSSSSILAGSDNDHDHSSIDIFASTQVATPPKLVDDSVNFDFIRGGNLQAGPSSETAQGAVSLTKTSHNRQSLVSKPSMALVKSVELPLHFDFVFQEDRENIPAEYQSEQLEVTKPKAPTKPSIQDRSSRRDKILEKEIEFQLPFAQARKMIYGKVSEDSCLVELESCFQEYPYWSVTQTYWMLLEMKQMLDKSERTAPTKLSEKKRFDDETDKQILLSVRQLTLADSLTCFGRLLKIKAYCDVHTIVEASTQRKIGKSIYDRFIEAEEAQSGVKYDIYQKRVRCAYWERTKGTGSKISSFVQEFGLSILLVMPEFVSVETLSRCTIGRCRILIHCLKHGPDAARLSSFCARAKSTVEVLLREDAEPGTQIQQVQGLLQYLSTALVFPTRFFQTFTAMNPIGQILDVLPPFDLDIQIGASPFRINRNNLATLGYDEQLDDRVILAVLRLYEHRIKPNMSVLDSLALQFENEKLINPAARFIADLLPKVIVPVGLSYPETQHLNHWLLVLVDAEAGQLAVLDSLDGKTTRNFVQKALIEQWEQYSTFGEKLAPVRIRPALQRNGLDCGIFLLLNAIFAMCGQFLPADSRYDCNYARRRFFCELMQLVEDAQKKTPIG